MTDHDNPDNPENNQNSNDVWTKGPEVSKSTQTSAASGGDKAGSEEGSDEWNRLLNIQKRTFSEKRFELFLKDSELKNVRNKTLFMMKMLNVEEYLLEKKSKEDLSKMIQKQENDIAIMQSDLDLMKEALK